MTCHLFIWLYQLVTISDILNALLKALSTLYMCTIEYIPYIIRHFLNNDKQVFSLAFPALHVFLKNLPDGVLVLVVLGGV